MNTGTILRRFATLTASFLLVSTAVPADLAAQEYPRSDLEEQLDQLATDRAQDLNRAYYGYEQSLEEARQEAQRRDQPTYFSERRTALRADLEKRVLEIERRYEQRRADLLQKSTGRRWEGGEAENRFEPPVMSGAERRAKRTRIAQLNTELAQAWSDFHEAANELREEARTNSDWSGYEQALSELEAEYHETITRIQEEQRELRFEMARDGTATEPSAEAGADSAGVD